MKFHPFAGEKAFALPSEHSMIARRCGSRFGARTSLPKAPEIRRFSSFIPNLLPIMKTRPARFPLRFPQSFGRLLVLSIFGVVAFAGCGGSADNNETAESGPAAKVAGAKSAGAAAAIEQHIAANEKLGTLLAHIRSEADLVRLKPELLRQARVLADSVHAMNATVMENASLSDAERRATLEPYLQRLQAASQAWRKEAERVADAFGREALDEVGAILSNPR